MAFQAHLPEFELETERRTPWVWPTLFILFGLLFLLAFAGYFGRSEKVKELYDEAQTQLRTVVVFKAITGQSSDDVQPLPKELLRLRSSDKKIQKLYAVNRFLGGHPLTPQDLSVVVASKDASDQAFAKIFLAKKLKDADAKRLADEVPDQPFVNSVARMAAFEKADDPHAIEQAVSPARITLGRTVLGLFLLGMFAGVILWIVYFVIRRNGGLAPLGHPAGNLSPGQSDLFAARTLQFLLVFIGVQVVVGVATAFRLSDNAAEFIGVGALAVSVFVLPRIPVASRHLALTGSGPYAVPSANAAQLYLPLSVQGWHARNLGRNIGWGVAAAIANSPVFLGLTLLGGAVFRFLPQQPHPIALQVANSRDLLNLLMILIGASVCAPIFEETMFRGTLLPAMASRFESAIAGALVSSLFFAMLHPTGPPSWFALAWVGVLSSALIYQTRSIVPSLVLHALFNAFQLLLVFAIA